MKSGYRFTHLFFFIFFVGCFWNVQAKTREDSVAKAVRQLKALQKQNALNDAQGLSHRNRYIFGETKWIKTIGEKIDEIDIDEESLQKLSDELNKFNTDKGGKNPYRVRFYVYLAGLDLTSPFPEKVTPEVFVSYKNKDEMIAALYPAATDKQGLKKRIMAQFEQAIKKDKERRGDFIRKVFAGSKLGHYDVVMGVNGYLGAGEDPENPGKAKLYMKFVTGFGSYGTMLKAVKALKKASQKDWQNYSFTQSPKKALKSYITAVPKHLGNPKNFDVRTDAEKLENLLLGGDVSWDKTSRWFEGKIRIRDIGKRKAGNGTPTKNKQYDKVVIADYVGLKNKALSFGTNDAMGKRFLALADKIKVCITNTQTPKGVTDYLKNNLHGGNGTFAEFASLQANEMMLWIHFDENNNQRTLFWFGLDVQTAIMQQLRDELYDFIAMFSDGRAMIEIMEITQKNMQLIAKVIRGAKTSEEFRKMKWLDCCEIARHAMGVVIAAYDTVVEEAAGAVETVGTYTGAMAFALHFARNDEGIRDLMLEEFANLTYDDVIQILGDVKQGVVADIKKKFDDIANASGAEKTYYIGRLVGSVVALINPFSKGKKISTFIKEFKEKIKKRKGKRSKKKFRVRKVNKEFLAELVSKDKPKKPVVIGKGVLNGKKLLVVSKLKPKLPYYTNGFIIKALLKKAQGEKGLYVAKNEASAKNSVVGKWALKHGYVAVKEGSGTRFNTYYVEKDNKNWIVKKNKSDQTILAKATYTDKLKTLKVELKTTTNEERVLNALWSKLTTGNSKKQVNVVYSDKKEDLNKFTHLKTNATQNELNQNGQKLALGKWAKNKGYPFTLVSRGNNKQSGTQGAITQVRFAKTACFVAGTKVWMHDYSQKNIEDVLPEDTVRAFDTATRQEVLGKVTHTMIKQASILIEVYTALDTFRVTPEHPFYVNGKWIQAGKLKKGYKLTLLNHRILLAGKTRHLPRSAEVLIDSIAVKDTLVTVYNFTVEKFHNYYVGNVGSLVHNNDCGTYKILIATSFPRKRGATGHNSIGFVDNDGFESWFEFVFVKSNDKTKKVGKFVDILSKRLKAMVRVKFKFQEFEVTKEQYNKAYKRLNQLRYQVKSSGEYDYDNEILSEYHLVNNSCTSNVNDILRAADFNIPQNVLAPFQLYNWCKQQGAKDIEITVK